MAFLWWVSSACSYHIKHIHSPVGNNNLGIVEEIKEETMKIIFILFIILFLSGCCNLEKYRLISYEYYEVIGSEKNLSVLPIPKKEFRFEKIRK